MVFEKISQEVNSLTDKWKKAADTTCFHRGCRKEYLLYALYAFLGFLLCAGLFLFGFLLDELDEMYAEGDPVALFLTGRNENSFWFRINGFFSEHDTLFMLVIMLVLFVGAALFCVFAFNLARGLIHAFKTPNAQRRENKARKALKMAEQELEETRAAGERLYREALECSPVDESKLCVSVDHGCSAAARRLIFDRAASCDLAYEKEHDFPAFTGLEDALSLIGLQKRQLFEIILWVQEPSFAATPDRLGLDELPSLHNFESENKKLCELARGEWDQRSARIEEECRRFRAQNASLNRYLEQAYAAEAFAKAVKKKDDDWMPPHIDVSDV